MMHLDTLKFGNAVASDTKSISYIRSKMVAEIDQQIRLANSMLGIGEPYMPRRPRKVVDQATGQEVVKEMPVRVSHWYFQQAGHTYVKLRYGNRMLVIDPKMPVILVESLDKVPAVLDTVKQAVIAGELDKVLTEHVAKRKPMVRKKA